MLKENRKAVTKKGQVIGYLYYAEEEKKVYFERGEKWIFIDTCVVNTLTKMEYEKIGEEKILIKLNFNDALEMRYILFLPDNMVATIYDFDKSAKFVDCPKMPYVLVYSLEWNESKCGRYWSIFGIYEGEFVLQELTFQPQIVATEEELYLCMEIPGSEKLLYVFAYDRNWKFLSKPLLVDLKMVAPGIWDGQELFSEKKFLYSDKGHKVEKEEGKQYYVFQKEGNYILNNSEHELYYTLSEKPITLPDCYIDYCRLRATENLALIFDGLRFSLYEEGHYLIKFKRIPENFQISEINLEEIIVTPKVVVFPNGKTYRRKK